MRQATNWIIGLLAGIAGGLMALAEPTTVSMGLILLFVAPMAIYIAALGWGTVCGLVAAIAATLVSSYGGDLASPVATGTLLFLPAAWAGHLANLARRETTHNKGNGAGETILWFPLSGILLRLMLALAAGLLLTGWASGFSGEELVRLFTQMMNEAVKSEPELANSIDIERVATLYARLTPLVAAALWLLMHVLVMNISAMIVRMSGRLARPAEDIAATVNLPVEVLVMPIAGLVGMVAFSGPLANFGAVFAGVGIAGFALIGLADLHWVSRGRPGRGAILFFSYLALPLFFLLPLAVFAFIGARRSIRWRGGASGNPPSPPARRPARPAVGPSIGRDDDTKPPSND